MVLFFTLVSKSVGFIQLLSYPKEIRISYIVKALFQLPANVHVILPFTVTSNHVTITYCSRNNRSISGSIRMSTCLGGGLLLLVRALVLCGQEGLCHLLLVPYHSGQDHFINISYNCSESRHLCRKSLSPAEELFFLFRF